MKMRYSGFQLLCLVSLTTGEKVVNVDGNKSLETDQVKSDLDQIVGQGGDDQNVDKNQSESNVAVKSGGQTQDVSGGADVQNKSTSDTNRASVTPVKAPEVTPVQVNAQEVQDRLPTNKKQSMAQTLREGRTTNEKTIDYGDLLTTKTVVQTLGKAQGANAKRVQAALMSVKGQAMAFKNDVKRDADDKVAAVTAFNAMKVKLNDDAKKDTTRQARKGALKNMPVNPLKARGGNDDWVPDMKNVQGALMKYEPKDDNTATDVDAGFESEGQMDVQTDLNFKDALMLKRGSFTTLAAGKKLIAEGTTSVGGEVNIGVGGEMQMKGDGFAEKGARFTGGGRVRVKNFFLDALGRSPDDAVVMENKLIIDEKLEAVGSRLEFVPPARQQGDDSRITVLEGPNLTAEDTEIVMTGTGSIVYDTTICLADSEISTDGAALSEITGNLEEGQDCAAAPMDTTKSKYGSRISTSETGFGTRKQADVNKPPLDIKGHMKGNYEVGAEMTKETYQNVKKKAQRWLIATYMKVDAQNPRPTVRLSAEITLMSADGRRRLGEAGCLGVVVEDEQVYLSGEAADDLGDCTPPTPESSAAGWTPLVGLLSILAFVL